MYCYLVIPQPKKSKQANEYPAGKYESNGIASSLELEFPCKYKTTIPNYYNLGLNNETSKICYLWFIIRSYWVYAWLNGRNFWSQLFYDYLM